jgi:hypothetical protein
VMLPQLNALMSRKCHNYAGRICVVNPEPTGTVCHVVVQLPQVRNCVYCRWYKLFKSSVCMEQYIKSFCEVCLILGYHLLTPWSRVLLEKLTGFAASQEIPRIYGTQKFITVLTSACHPWVPQAAYFSPFDIISGFITQPQKTYIFSVAVGNVPTQWRR